MIDLTKNYHPREVDATELQTMRSQMCGRIDDEYVCTVRIADGRCNTPLGPDDLFCCAQHEPFRINIFRKKRASIVAEFCKNLEVAPILEGLPRLSLARVTAKEFQENAPKQFQNLAHHWQPKHGSVLLCGPPGTWKTSALVALIHRMIDGAKEELTGLPFDAIHQLKTNGTCADAARYAHWTSALDLVMAARHHPLGQSEAKAIRVAKAAQLLILDELGPQAPTDRDAVIMDVLDTRYRAGLLTLGTTGMSSTEFQTAHGGGVWRRLTDKGVGRVLEVKRG